MTRISLVCLALICAGCSCLDASQKPSGVKVKKAEISYKYLEVSNFDQALIGDEKIIKTGQELTINHFSGIGVGGRPEIESESENVIRSSTGDFYSLYTELSCAEYSTKVLCVPAINLYLPIAQWADLESWTSGESGYRFAKTGQATASLFGGRVSVAIVSGNPLVEGSVGRKFTYLISERYGLVGFFVESNSGKQQWLLSDEERCGGIGAYSFRKEKKLDDTDCVFSKQATIVEFLE